MDRLTFEGNFCYIAMCQDTPGGSFCDEGYCYQRKVWERLKQYEDTGLEPEEIVVLTKEDAEFENQERRNGKDKRETKAGVTV